MSEHANATLVRHMLDAGFSGVGLASNGFLLGQHRERLDELVKAGLGSLNLSLDGPAEYHNALRRHPKAYDLAISALVHALRFYSEVLEVVVTISVSPGNFQTYPIILELLEQLGVPYVKIVAVMPYGEAEHAADLGLSDEQFVQLLENATRIRRCFDAGETPMRVSMTDDGFLGCFEGASRDGFLNCPAGVDTAAILQDGRLSACAQMTQPFSVAGDLRSESFASLWKDGFREFRNRRWLHKGMCSRCVEWRYCQGGSMHDRAADGTPLRCNALRVRRALEARARAAAGPKRVPRATAR